MEVRLYRGLNTDMKTRLRAEAAFMCPRIFKGERKPDKPPSQHFFLDSYAGNSLTLCNSLEWESLYEFRKFKFVNQSG